MAHIKHMPKPNGHSLFLTLPLKQKFTKLYAWYKWSLHLKSQMKVRDFLDSLDWPIHWRSIAVCSITGGRAAGETLPC